MLEAVWFVLWGVLWAVYFVLDGFDLGLGILMPFLAKSEDEKATVRNAVGPFWDGNEVWLLTAGGVTFAAFPGAYAAIFSSFYTPLMFILFALIIRGVSLEFRNQREGRSWRRFWDGGAFVGSFVPALLFGVAFANIFKGIPIDREGVFHGSLVTFLNPYGLAGGLLFLFLFLVHGSLWLALRSEGELRKRAALTAQRLWPVATLLAVLFLVLTAIFTRLYDNYLRGPLLLAIPLLTVGALLSMRFFVAKGAWGKAWIASALTIAGATLFGVIGLYPTLLPSSLGPLYGLTTHNASSSPLTLKIMLGVALVFVPVVMLYQAWTYRLFLNGPGADGSGEETY